MTEKTWKVRERMVAEAVGGKRIPVTGERAGSDVDTPLLCVQVKHGRSRPAYLREWLTGIQGAAKAKNKTGIVVWSVGRERLGDAVVVLSLRDFQALHGTLPLVDPVE